MTLRDLKKIPDTNVQIFIDLQHFVSGTKNEEKLGLLYYY